MSKKTNLSPERLEQLNAWFAEKLTIGVPSSRADLGRSVWTDLMRAARDDGNIDALDFLCEGALDGLEERAYAFLKSDTGIISVRADDGSSLSVRTPTRVAIRGRRPDGTPTHQLRLWWEVSWSEYATWRDAMFALERKIALKRYAFDRIDALQAAYPETDTPGEACEAAGIDPRSLGLDEVA